MTQPSSGQAPASHLLHEAKLRSRENVSHVPLLLPLIADRVFDRTAIELRDLVKFIQADGYAKSGFLGQLT